MIIRYDDNAAIVIDQQGNPPRKEQACLFVLMQTLMKSIQREDIKSNKGSTYWFTNKLSEEQGSTYSSHLSKDIDRLGTKRRTALKN